MHAVDDAADHRVRFTGAIHGSGYRPLESDATMYIQATEVGGTHPAVVEAMGLATPSLPTMCPDTARPLRIRGAITAEQLISPHNSRSTSTTPEELERRRTGSHQLARDHYSWDTVEEAYDTWFRGFVGQD